MVAGTATIKQVVSGDTLVLMGAPRGGPPPEKQVTLASVLAPRLGMKSQAYETADEPFAWEAREFFRKLITGEVVEFVVEYEDRGKEFASVRFKGEDLGRKIIAAGLAKVRNSRPPLCAKNIDELRTEEENAKREKKNIWAAESSKLEAAIRHVHWIANDAAATKAFASTHIGQCLPAIVEFIRDAGSYRVYFTKELVNASVVLSGIQVDGFRRIEGTDTMQPEPFAAEAKYFTEVRLLNRDVDVRIEGADDYGNLIGTLIHPKGNITELLLRNGFGKVNDRTALLTKDAALLRTAQKEAQASKIRKWRNFQPNVSEDMVREYTARVVEVVSGDCLIVAPQTNVETPEERRLYLASIRCPRMGTRMRPDEPWAFEAKELARKKLVGKKVKVLLEYTREPMTSAAGAAPPPASDSSGRMHFVSVLIDGGKLNFNELLIQEGLARTLPHRSEDPSASNYGILIEKESKAAAEKKGVHGAPAPLQRINDLVGADHSKQAKSLAESLKRTEKFDAVVEHIFNGGRFKIRIASVGDTLDATAGPPVRGQQRQAEEFSEEALQFSRDHYMQRNVTVSINACDLRGTFIGIMWHGKDCVNVQLVAHGMAEVVERSSVPSAISKELRAAEAEASEKRLGLWSTCETRQEEVAEAAGISSAQSVGETLDSVVVSYAVGVDDFYVTQHPSASLDALQERIAAHIKSLTGPSALSQMYTSAALPKVGDIVLAEYPEDGKWYRARVESIDRKALQFYVCYIDYGNCSRVPLEKFRRRPAFADGPAYARRCRLAGVKPPLDMEPESADAFDALCCDELPLRCVVEYMEPSTRKSAVQLYSKSTGLNVAESLVAKGLAVCDRRSKTSIGDTLLKAQDQAKKQRLNVWRHGDIGDSDDENISTYRRGRN